MGDLRRNWISSWFCRSNYGRRGGNRLPTDVFRGDAADQLAPPPQTRDSSNQSASLTATTGGGSGCTPAALQSMNPRSCILFAYYSIDHGTYSNKSFHRSIFRSHQNLLTNVAIYRPQFVRMHALRRNFESVANVSSISSSDTIPFRGARVFLGLPCQLNEATA